MRSTLQSMLQETLEARSARLARASSPVIEDASPASTRSTSPARSISSESTTSTHTATPQTPRPLSAKGKQKGNGLNGSLNGLTRLTPSPAPSDDSSPQSLASVTTSRTITPTNVNRSRSVSRRNLNGSHRTNSSQKNEVASLRTTATAALARSTSSGSSAVREPSTLTVIRSYIDNFVHNATKSKVMVYFVVFVVFPAISLAVRIRRRNFRLAQAGQGAQGAADVVRRRLKGTTSGPGGSLLGSLWNEVTRAVGDTIRMGGGGLA